MNYSKKFESIKAVKMLLCAGADLTSQNIEGETVLQALDQGLIDELNRNPQLEIFIRDRYTECRSFITNFKPAVEKTLVFRSYKKKDKSVITDKDVTDMSVSNFISEFSSNENKFKEFITSKDNITNILIEIFTYIIDKGINEDYKNVINIIKILATDDTFKQNIIDCIQNDDIQELIQFDAPYAKEEINNICNILQIEEIK